MATYVLFWNPAILSYSEERFLADVELLTPEVLTQEIPDFNWYGGHSGRRLDDEDAKKLDSLWKKYLLSHPNLIQDDLAFKNQGWQ